MARILITGAAGFIGRSLISTLQDQNELYALVRCKPTNLTRLDVQWITHDLTRPLDLARLPKQIDAVIHLAQSRHYRDFPAKVDDIFVVNVQGTLHLLEYARAAGARHFIFASTGGLYGYSSSPFFETNSVDSGKFIEVDPNGALNFYFASKHFAEILIHNYRRFFRTIVLRFFFVYGPGQHGMLIPNLVQRVKDGQLITIQGDPGLRINPVYIEDAIRVFEPALRLPDDGVFNVTGDDIVSLTELVEMIARIANVPVKLIHTGEASPGDLIGDNSRMRKVLGACPQVPLAVGLRNLIFQKDVSDV